MDVMYSAVLYCNVQGATARKTILRIDIHYI